MVAGQRGDGGRGFGLHVDPAMKDNRRGDMPLETENARYGDRICKLCGASRSSRVVFEGQIRAGRPGLMTDRFYIVAECEQCGIQHLEPFPDVAHEFYVTGVYREAYGDSIDVDDFLRRYDDEQIERAERIGLGNIRGKIIGDFGCGGGSFLDLVHGLVAQTVAIEPMAAWHSSLKERGHTVFQWGKEIPRETLDVAVSFDVIEHGADPVVFLKEVYSSLKPTGIAHVVTPNRNEILMKLHADHYSNFYYRTAHLWYFDARSLMWAAHQAGFMDVEVNYQHKYDLSNAFCWFRDNRPTGARKIDIFDDRLNHQWRDFLEERGWADNLWLVARKTDAG